MRGRAGFIGRARRAGRAGRAPNHKIEFVQVVELALLVAELPGHVGGDAALPVLAELLEELQHRAIRQAAVPYDLHNRS